MTRSPAKWLTVIIYIAMITAVLLIISFLLSLGGAEPFGIWHNSDRP